MLDIKFIRENSEKVKESIKNKGYDPEVVDQVLKLDSQRRKILARVEKLRGKRNLYARQKEILKGKKLKEELEKVEEELRQIEEEFKNLLWQIPNLATADVLLGKDESENKVIRTWGKPTKFDFKVRDHVELGEILDIIDIPRAAKVSGTRFGYLKNEGVILEFALVQFTFEALVEEGFIPIVPPVLISKRAMEGMGYLEHGGEEETYHFLKDDLYLVGTSEQSIGPMHTEEIFIEKNLPRRYVAFSPCFRREAGSYGKDTRGIFRVHQFDKVEMFSFAKPEDSDREHEYFLSLEEKLVQALRISYQVVKMCTGDLGFPTARKYDIECWFSSQGRYRETHSTSTCTDFQSRRLNIRYRTKEGKTEYIHTLNGTAFAIGRMIIAILENYQQKDSSVLVPKVLQKYTGFAKISPKNTKK